MSPLRARRRAACAAGFLAALAGCVEGDLPPRPDEFGDGGGLVTLARGSGCGAVHLVVSAGRLYWTEQDAGTVKSVSTQGGAVTMIATGQTTPGALAVDSASLFWVAGGLKTIMKKPLAGGNASSFLPPSMAPETFGDENRINALLVESSTLYFGRFTFAFKMPTAGGMPKVLMQSPSLDQGRPAAFALDSTRLYQTEGAHLAVSREKLDGTQEGFLEDGAKAPFAPDRIAASQSSLLLDAIAVVDNRVIWAAGPSIESKPVDAQEGSEATIITSTINGNDVTGFAVTGNDVYFGEAGTDTVERASLQGGTATIVVAGQSHPTQFAADDQNVYWATADCKIRKWSKP